VGLRGLHDESLVDVRDHTAASNSGLDQSVELFVTADSQLQVTGSDALDLEVLRGVARKFENFSGQVLEDRGRVHSRSRTNSAAGVDSGLEDSVNSSNGELHEKVSKNSAKRQAPTA